MDTEQNNKEVLNEPNFVSNELFFSFFFDHARLLLTLFQLGRDNFYHRDSISRVTKPSWNRVKQ